LEETHSDRVRSLEERSKIIQLPIVSLLSKAYILLVGTAQKLQIIHKRGVLHVDNTK